MFGSLKKRLKEAVEKVSKSISKEEPQPKQLPEKEEPQKKEEPQIKEEPAANEDFIIIEEPLTKEEPIKKEEILVKEAIKKGVPIKEVKKEETLKEKKKLPETDDESQEESLFGPEDEEPYKEKEEEIDLEVEIDKEIEELEEIKEEVAKERLSPQIAESEIEVKEAEKEEKTSHGFSFFRRVSEKKLSDTDIEKILKELHLALLENDVAVEVADRISTDVKKELFGASVKRGKVENTIKDALRNAMLDVMKQDKIDMDALIKKKEGPFTIMMVGFNGVGKTTTLAKLANKLKKYKPVLAAADTFRAASIEQLEEHGRRLDMRVIKHAYGSDAAAVIFDAKKHAEANGSKLVLADTAGRSHSNVNLMDELKKVARVNNPDMKILVLDSITGNDIYDQCRLFNDAVGVDAIILTKADVYEKGGSALSAAFTLKKPILYMGVGQEYGDLKEFDPEEIVNNLLK